MNNIADLTIRHGETVEAHKVRSLSSLIENLQHNFPGIKKDSFKIVFSNTRITETDLKSVQAVLCINDEGLSYWFTPYSEPGSPRISHYKFHNLNSFLEKIIKKLIISNCAPKHLLKEKNLYGKYKTIAEKLLILQQEEKKIMLEDIKKVLNQRENHHKFYLALREENISQIKHFQNNGTAQDSDINEAEIEEYVTLSAQKNSAGVTSKRKNLLFKLMWSASRNAKKNSGIPWNSKEHEKTKEKLEKHITNTTLDAKEYFEEKLTRLKDSDYVKSINGIIFS